MGAHPEWLRESDGGGAPQGAMAVGLALVERGVAFEGPLTHFHDEAWLQFAWFYQPLDAFTLKAKAAWKLKEPQTVFVGRSLGRNVTR